MDRLKNLSSSHRSYHHTPFSKPTCTPYHTLPEVFDFTANRVPNRTAAVVYRSREHRDSLTFAELQNHSKTLAAALAERGYKRGDRVAFFAPNCIEFFTVPLALSRLGCNLLLLANLTSLAGDIWQYKCRALIMFLKSDQEIKVCREILARVSSEMLGKDVIVFGPKCDVIISDLKCDATSHKVVSLSNVMEGGGAQNWDDIVTKIGVPDPGDPVFVLFTSGSTGKPKGVQFTHSKYLHQSITLDRLGVQDGSRYYNDRPMTWLGGSTNMLSAAVFGARAVTVNTALVVGGEDFDFVMEIIQREECTDVTMMLYFMVDLLRRYNPLTHAVPFVKHIVTGGQRLKMDVAEKICELLPHVEFIVTCYGSAEVGLVTSTRCIVNEDGEDIHEGVEIRIVDENHRDVPRETSGELCIRSPTIFSDCYIDNERASKSAFDAAGWFYTGDIGTMSMDGKITICGRKDEMIKRATVKLFPATIETALKLHPAINDVVVIGVPDIRLGEDICACVLLDDVSSLVDIKAWCKDKFPIGRDGLSLAPAYYVPFPDFPKTATGKTNRKVLKQWALETLNM